MKKNHVIILSVILGVLAAVAATALIIRHLRKKAASIAPANLSFETDFAEETEE